MATFSDRIKSLRLQHNLTQNDLAEKIKVNKQTISQYERGVRRPDFDTLNELCDFFNVSSDFLLGKSDVTVRLLDMDSLSVLSDNDRISLGKYRIPVVATVAAGEPIFSEESILEWIDYDKDPRGEVFGLRIKGDSMIPRISDGDTIVVDKSAVWEDGDIVVVTVNGNDGTCKRIKKYKDGISLISLNPSYEPIFFTKSQVEELPVRVVGRVMESRSKF
ncbi:MAG: LexA family protein [Candidatus Alectryocaccobium sp.]|jgi:repressor LexA